MSRADRSGRRLFVSPDAISEETAQLSGADHHHVVNVLRLGVGSALSLVDGSGIRYDGEIVNITKSAVGISIHDRIALEHNLLPRIEIVCGLARDWRNEWILQKCTELGVNAFWHAICARSLSKPSRGAKKAQRWREIVRQAARQCGAYHLPSVNEPVSLTSALAQASADAAIKVLANPGAPAIATLATDLRSNRGKIVYAVGPEGGFTESEIRSAEAAGYRQIGLGAQTLRSETAAVVGLALLSYLSGRLSTV